MTIKSEDFKVSHNRRTGVAVTHLPTGIRVSSTKFRYRSDNLDSCVEEFKFLIKNMLVDIKPS